MCRRGLQILGVAVLVLVVAGCNLRITDGNDESLGSSISGDGRYLAYHSFASNLVPGDTNGVSDAFVLDRDTGVTVRITNGNGHTFVPVLATDGSSVAYLSAASNLVPGDTNGFRDVFVWNATSHATTKVTAGNRVASGPGISGDGLYVAFDSPATNLVPGDTNGVGDVFVWDAATGATVRLTNGNSSSWRPRLSADGTKVTFASAATNLVPGDTNGVADVFVWDATTNTTTRITNGDKRSIDPDISGDGGKIVFTSEATNLVPGVGNQQTNIFLWTAATGAITRLTDGDAGSGPATISDDGSHVAFTSTATNLAPNGQNFTADVFLTDLVAGTTKRLTDGSRGSQDPGISANGRYVVFDSFSDDLVGYDTNGVQDIFLWDTLHFAD